MLTEKKTLDGFVNGDDAAESVAPNEIIHSVNMRFGTTDTGAGGRWESILSNASIANAYLPAAGTNTDIGSVSDEAGRYIVFFVENSGADDRILLYFKSTNTFYKVLTGDLGFNKSYLVKAGIVNDILYWTDNLNEPRRINLAAGIKLNHAGSSPIASTWQYTTITDAYEYTIIRRPPPLTGYATKIYDGSFANNYILNESFQFAWQFVYWDGEMSTLSLFTKATKLNTTSENFNKITTILHEDTIIADSIRIVRLIVRRGGEISGEVGKCFVIKTWDRSISATEINAHIAHTTPLTYDFYNDIIGEAIDDNYSFKPFDSVPLISGVIEPANNRIFLVDNTEGYDSPVSTSLALTTSSLAVGGTTTYVGPLFSIQHRNTNAGLGGGVYAYSAWYIFLNTTASQVGYYEVVATAGSTTGSDTYPTLPAQPTTVAFSALAYKGLIRQTAVQNTRPGGRTFTSEILETATGNNLTVTGIVTSITFTAHKGMAQYRAGVVFYDKALRKCGVVTSEGVKVSVPVRNFAYTTGTASINWSLSNASALTEIPDWAHYYTVVLTKDLRTRFFIQGFDNAARYATKDANGDYIYTATTFGTGTVGIAIDTTALTQATLGYVFEEGDQAVLVDNIGNVVKTPIIETDGKYIILQPSDLGNLAARQIIFEIYKPYKASVQEPYYEMGEMFPITLPGTVSRVYSKIIGAFPPDSFVLTRTYNAIAYFAETMSPNDKFYKRWDTDHGRINIVTSEGRRRNKTAIAFSNRYVPGTQTNGLSSFEPLNGEILPLEMGQVMGLTLTSKVQTEGTVMLAVGKNETASIYLGETQVTNSDGSTYFIKDKGVISQVSVLRGNYGTINPESIVKYRGNVYWFDAGSSAFLQYSTNGIDPISDFKMRRFAHGFSKKYLATSAATIEGYGGRPFVFGGVDPYHEEIYWSIPKLDTVIPKGVLADYSSLPAYVDSADYPYDMLDHKAKTIVYKLGATRWMGEFTWQNVENFITIDNDLYSFKAGVLYNHNVSGTYNTFYGSAVKSKLMFVSNGEPSKPKVYQGIAVESSEAPQFTHFRSEYPNVQSTDLISTDYSNTEGVFYSSILRDRLSPNVSGAYDAKIYTGDKMRTQALRCLIQFSNTTSLVWLREVNISLNASVGHTV